MFFSLQPFAWEAREFLRRKVIGKDVRFSVEYESHVSGKQFGSVFLGSGALNCVVVYLCDSEAEYRN